MTALALVLLGVGVVGAVLHVRRPVLVVVPVLAAAVAVAAGLLDGDGLRDVVDALAPPLAFLLLSVPMAVLLDRLGAFDAVARRLPARWLAPGLWALGAVTVALVNLDAAVVLLTPLAVAAARRSGLDARGLALQPFLLAALASTLLPVSNLTNLIAEERDPQGPGAFLVHLGLPTVAMVVVGYLLWAVWWRPSVPPGGPVGPPASPPPPRPAAEPAPASGGDDRAATVTAVLVGAALLVGFTVGGAVGVPPWVVVAVVLVGLAVRARAVPVRSVPWTSALAVLALAVLAVAAAARVDIGALLGDGRGPLGTLRIVAVAAVAANLVNNLPAFLAGVPSLPPTEGARWAWLLGVDAGPTVLVSGSLAGLLWLEVVRRSGLALSWRDVARAGLRVGVPALAVGAVVLALTGA
ncbi:ArsB/NhaD family transporter [Iamia majanohamensis]|uniref:ArsB/NhaD family transporter n=1 Tax=Iamia majanohamensis TaxID=467976 RepID=A0AAE9Y696_9ACTN|nr:ArsB/NhaD family transporter [Iamia majanohamensis]WCO67685.1 ArsB/NhaD family transporter [Iamia majanohamensis]